MLSQNVLGANRTWINSGTGNWSNQSNWSGSIPGNIDTAIINNSGTAILSTASGTTYQLYLGESGTGTLNFTQGTHTFQLAVIGYTGSGFMNVSEGTLNGSSGSIGVGSNSVGTAQVSSGEWILSGNIDIGASGTGTLLVNGGFLSSRTAGIGTYAGSVGIATISSGTWENTFRAQIGLAGAGALTINGGKASLSTVGLGSSSGGYGIVNLISGTFDTNGFYIGEGDGGSGTFNMSGGSASNLFTRIGSTSQSGGAAYVTGGTWENQGDFTVGNGGSGTFVLSDGLVSNQRGYVAYSISGSGSAVVAGGTWNNRSSLDIGYGGRGALTISGSGNVVVNSGSGIVRISNTGNGTLNIGDGNEAGILHASEVTGGSYFGNPAIVNFNHSESYDFTPKMSGVLQVNHLGTGTTTLHGVNTYSGRTTLSAGVLELGSSEAIPFLASSTISFAGGSLRFTALNTRDYSDQFSDDLDQKYRIDTNAQNLTFAGALTSSGGELFKTGEGSLTLTGTNSYTGGTKVHEGTLVISDIGTGFSVLGSGSLEVEVGGTLAGSGTVLGDTEVSGMLAPGHSSGTMHFANSLFLDGTAFVAMKIEAAEIMDQVVVDGILTYDGVLSITLSGSFFPQVGDTLTLFHAASVAGNSQFDSITFNVSGYSASMNYDMGTLTITAIPEPTTVALLSTALVGLLCHCRRKRF